MADQRAVMTSGEINDKALRDTYEFLLRSLQASGLRATAAFVTCFAAGPSAVRERIGVIEQLAGCAPGWFTHLLPAIKAAQFDGLNGAEYFKGFVRDGHELAWHGATHMPLTDQTPIEALELELSLTRMLFRELGQTPGGIVFPRNLVGHLPRLRTEGFHTYRLGSPRGILGRIKGLLDEWNAVDSRVQAKPVYQNGWHVSPAGFFLNWPSGVRRLVPVPLTVQRWRSLLRAAVSQGGYVHMWFHPHNLITAPAMRLAFAEIMREVGLLVRSGYMVNLTMSQANDHFGSPGVK